MREWRSKDGSQTLTAQYITLRHGKDIVLLGEEKQQVKVPVSKLSAEGQEYVFQAESRKALNGGGD